MKRKPENGNNAVSKRPAIPSAVLEFRHPWRPYQEEILRDFEMHLEDGHFHVVAAPGSGKTVLGIEVLRLLGKPALIFAPTVVIREQWIERLLRDFTNLPPEASGPDWISRDPAAPGWWTFTTYQAVSACHKRDGGAALLEGLRAAGVEVLAVDEAHHLRAFWWKCLREIKGSLAEVTVISLTATPPYDVPQAEWNRYAAFCGEVDAEVTAPELVAAGSLCAHQDLVHLSVPLPGETAMMEEHHFRVERLFRDFCLDGDLAGRLFDLQVFQNVEDAALLENPDFYLGAALYFSEVHGRIPSAVLNGLDLHEVPLPPFDLCWLARFLTGLCFGPGEKCADLPELKIWKQKLHEAAVLHQRKVLFEPPEARERALARSVRKLDGVAEILAHESSVMRHRLRAVVLCDHIRERDFPSGLGAAAERPFERLGVVPAFECVRRLQLPHVKPAILTGSLMVIPVEAREFVVAGCAEAGVGGGRLSFAPLPHAPAFLKIGCAGSARHVVTGVMTRLLEEGEITALFGTAALLGEGWDAPAVNTLVIASTIGAFVTSNQMRGRAIRSVRNDPEKAANIWHLASICDHERDRSGSDFGNLSRRFGAFAGLSETEGNVTIECGIGRLGLEGIPSTADVPEINAAMFRRSSDRPEMLDRWKRAVAGTPGSRVRLTREVSAPARRLESAFTARIRDMRWLDWLYRRFTTRRMERTARAVFDALRSNGSIDAGCPESALVFRAEEGSCFAALEHRPLREQSAFARAMLEVFDPFATRPRYLVLARSGIYCVPAAFAVNARTAKVFSAAWDKHAGTHRLVFTGNAGGRRELLRLRGKALLRRFDFQPGVRTRWR